jgi:protein-tyrosine phosphatase
MSCISCDSNNTTITYNTLKYCKKCFDEMSVMFQTFTKNNEKNVDKTYQPPTKITDNVYIGCLNSVNREKLNELNINHIIVAGKNLTNENHDGFNVLELLIDDSFEQELISNVKLANNYMKSIDNSNINDPNNKSNVLIHCYSGISRSGSILIGYLMEKNKMSYDKAFELVKTIYPKVFPNENFQKQLRDFENNNNFFN